MIKLEKGPVPKVLVDNAIPWTEVIIDKIGAGIEPTASDKRHYSHLDIKTALIAETNGKCAYCESKIRHISYGDIEHITPKSIVPERMFDWSNLTIACDMCNTNKSDFYGDHNTFVDPYIVDPESVFDHYGALILGRPGNEAAKLTEKLLKLNRAELVERRQSKLKELLRHLDVIATTADPALKAILQSDFLLETGADREFAGLARVILRSASANVTLTSSEPTIS